MISVDDKAVYWLKSQLLDRGYGSGIRLGTKTSGCTGYKYILEYVNEPTPEDISFETLGLTFFVDPKSMPMLKGMNVVYKVEGLNEGIDFENPNVSAQCGCGESFAI